MRTSSCALAILLVLLAAKWAHIWWGSDAKADTYNLLAGFVACMAFGAQIRDWRGR